MWNSKKYRINNCSGYQGKTICMCIAGITKNWFEWLRGVLEPYQTSKTELFVKIVNSWKPLTVFAKRFILDIWRSSEYATGNWLIASVS